MRASDGEILEALEPFGYYDGKVTHRLDQRENEFHAMFEVSPGDPVVVSESRVTVSGDGAQVPAVAKAIRAFVPKVGSPLDHAEYERSKAGVANALAGSGYLTARARTHRVEVTTGTHSAKIDLEWDGGIRYRFGAVRFPTTRLSDALLARMVPWQEGDFYSAEKLLEFQRRLNQADYFATANVQPRLEEALEARVPVNVALTPARRNVYRGGLYVSTDTGAGVRLSFQRRWLNRYGHKLETDVDSAQRLQAASVGYRVPFAGPHERAIRFGATYRDETTDSNQETTGRIAASVSRKWRDFTASLGLQMIAGDFELGSEHGNSTELYGEAVLTRTQADDPAFPRQGYAVTAETRVAPAEIVSRTPFATLAMRAKWITPAGDKSRVLLRANAGATTVEDFDLLPPDLRFFTGGDRSIRGFDYEAIGSRNDAGDVIGGTFLAIVSAEYERYLHGKWGGAVFVDAGDAFLKSDFDWNVGVGIGVRWKSPVGVVRFDIALPVATALEKSARMHLTIGPDL